MFNIAICQINPWVGNLSFNLDKIKEFYSRIISSEHVDLVVFPECAVTGYPLEDLVLKPYFMEQSQKTVLEIAKLTDNKDTAVLVGCPWIMNNIIVNAAIFIANGKIKEIICKRALPNYGVFDEKRIFNTHHQESSPLEYKGYKIGVMICEDMWDEEPAISLKDQGAELLLVINGSPFDLYKQEKRYLEASARVKQTNLPLFYLNMIGGQDSLVFDGRSFVMNQEAEMIALFSGFQEEYKIFSVNRSTGKLTIESTEADLSISNPEDHLCLLYQSLVLSLKDYIRKNHFKGVLIGLSGGIDSALSAAIAVDALGKEKVSCVMMPSPYTSTESLEDAKEIAHFLGVSYDTIPIETIMKSYTNALSFKFKDSPQDITEENIQARIRGMLLMALSNKFGFMVLSTGNKSEMAVGYATLYGDMCGGFNCLKDVYKTQVFELSKWRNHNYRSNFLGPRGAVMTARVITKPPSAELRANQKDQDSLPAYDVLDKVLFYLIEADEAVEKIVEKGFSKEEVIKVAKLLDGAEYKRRQASPGPKVTEKALSGERRYPITNGFMN